MNLRTTSRTSTRAQLHIAPAPTCRAGAGVSIAVALMMTVGSAFPVRAAETPPSASAQQIIDRLAPAAPRPAAPATGTTAPTGAASAGSVDGTSAQQVLRNLRPVERRIDLSIAFQFDAAMLQPEGQSALNELALAMQSERLRNMRFRIEGHTDAKGSADYNDRLSEQRARAAASFLVRQGVEPQRLQTVGKGSREPLPGEDPLAPINRRVRIVAID